MKCPKCHIEVEQGFLYCPNCLTEVPWVQEFNSVETLLQKKELEKPLRQKTEKSPVRIKSRTTERIIGICLLAVFFAGFFGYRELNSFSFIYERGVSAYENGRYDRALSLAEAARDREPDDLSANLLLAEVLAAQGDMEAALLVLKPMLAKYPTDGILYRTVADFLYTEGRTEEIRALLKSSNSEKVLSVCAEYISRKPSANVKSGTYTTMQEVTLSAENAKIYYTLNGTEPTMESTLYTDKIPLQEGTTVLRAIAVNEKNIASEIVSKKYVIVRENPDPPVVLPESGTFNTDTKIEILVPDGCLAYYAFDQIPTVHSTQYTRPISMPVYSHTFYAILVAANGKVSEATKMEYYLEY